jgi:hypothetical protein
VRAIAIVCFAAACARGPDVRHAEVDASPVRMIDWQNHTYTLGNGLGEVTVTKGDADFSITEDGKVAAAGAAAVGEGEYHVEPPLFADINNDGVEDAVISAMTATGGTGRFSEIDIYTVRDHQIVQLATITGGDRGDGGIRSVSLDGAAIIVERNVLAEGDGICCATKAQSERWSWRNGALAEDVAARKPIAAAAAAAAQ